MGYLKEQTGFALLGQIPPGTCPMCAVEHEPDQPHNQQSLAWQYNFYDQHGRFPRWADAMAHCSSKVKSLWMDKLKERGIDVDREAGAPEAVSDA